MFVREICISTEKNIFFFSVEKDFCIRKFMKKTTTFRGFANSRKCQEHSFNYQIFKLNRGTSTVNDLAMISKSSTDTLYRSDRFARKLLLV